jgi:hypothetical protein
VGPAKGFAKKKYCRAQHPPSYDGGSDASGHKKAASYRVGPDPKAAILI